MAHRTAWTKGLLSPARPVLTRCAGVVGVAGAEGRAEGAESLPKPPANGPALQGRNYVVVFYDGPMGFTLTRLEDGRAQVTKVRKTHLHTYPNRLAHSSLMACVFVRYRWHPQVKRFSVV
jgi:hypothetical protein